eukprot:3858726-Pyramimonas_sp.AAC.1
MPARVGDAVGGPLQANVAQVRALVPSQIPCLRIDELREPALHRAPGGPARLVLAAVLDFQDPR